MKRYYITDRKSVGGFHSLLEIIRDQMHLGVDYIQIREKDVCARELFEFAAAVASLRKRELPAAGRTKVLVNTRADVALAAGCDGVHLPSYAPRQTMPHLLVARSCHTAAEVAGANVDLVTFGPVFASPGKGEPVGLAALRDACRAGRPVFALGGVTWSNASQCMKAGAAGVAGIRLFQQPEL
jgi:thiamine-phosphate pyrophosphorylase